MVGGASRSSPERPVYGTGLGYEYVFWDQGYFVFKPTDLTHNIFGDLLLRSGAVGLALFLLAFGMTSVALARAWWTQRVDRAAAFALGVGAAVAGLVGKGDGGVDLREVPARDRPRARDRRDDLPRGCPRAPLAEAARAEHLVGAHLAAHARRGIAREQHVGVHASRAAGDRGARGGA